MAAIALDDAMQHVRAEEEDRSQVQLFLDAAEDSASQFMNRKFFSDSDSLDAAVLSGEAGIAPIVLNPSVRAACLLILGSLFENREDVVIGTISSELPLGSRSLLTPYRVGWGI